MLVYLLDAYCEEEIETSKGVDTRVVMKLHPRLAPVKVAVLPLVKEWHARARSQRCRCLL